MRLEKVTLRNYRGVSEQEVEFGAGVTVIEGPNEVGKSSIAEALRLLRKFKSSSKNAEVRGAQPIGKDVGPEVIVEMRTGAYQLTYRKRWLKAHLTELAVSQPAPAQYSGDEAHDRFQQILDETVDLDLLDALDVVQGQSLDQPDLAKISALRQTLDDAGGTVSSAELGAQDALMTRIESEFALYFTKTGRPNAEYKAAETSVEQLRGNVERLSARSKEVDKLTEEQARITQQLTKQKGQITEAEAAKNQIQTEVAALETLRNAAEQADAQLREAETQLTAAAAAEEARAAEASEAKTLAEKVQRDESDLEVLAATHENARSDFEAAEKEQINAEAARERARAEAKTVSNILRSRRGRDKLEALRDRIRRAQKVETDRKNAEAILEACTIDDAAAAELAEFETAVMVAESARQAAAAEVTVRSLGARTVEVDGEEIKPDTSVVTPVLNPVSIRVDGVLTVDIRPGRAPGELEENARQAKESLRQALDSAEVESVEEARSVALRRSSAQRQFDQASAALEHILNSAGFMELEAELLELEKEAAALEAKMSAYKQGSHEDQARSDDSVGLADLERQSRVCDQKEDEADAQMKAAQSDFETARRVAETARESWVIAKHELDRNKGDLAQLEAKLGEARAQTPDETLTETRRKAETKTENSKRIDVEAREELARANPEDLEMRKTHAEAVLVSLQEQKESSRNRLVEIQALLDDRATEGIYDRLSETSAALEAAKTKFEQMTRAADAVGLLRKVMERRREEAQQKYVAPFRERIENLGRGIFGGDFTVQVSSDLVIKSRTLENQTVPFESLSAGAKEQLALLGRLAVAQLVAEGEGAPIILDDTMGFADPDRLAALNMAIHHVGQSAQVVLLTCQPDRFVTIGASKVEQLSP